MRRTLKLIGALFVALALLAGCGSSSKSGSGNATTTTAAPTTSTPLHGSITASAASSLTGVFTALKAGFEAANPGATVTLNFGASGVLETQVESGAPADVVAFADAATMKKLADKSLLAAPAKVFARNRLVIVTKPGNPKHVASLDDLANVGVVSLCGATVPCGKYAGQILQTAGVTIPASKITRGQDVKTTLAAVTTGDADAAIVYVTDALAAGSKVTSVAIPDATNAIASYPIAVIKATENQPVAQAFLDYVVSAAGQAALRKAGFLAA